VQIDDPDITKLREMVTAAQQEFEYAIQFHEVWKIAADDSDLHKRMGRSYAAQAFLIIRSGIRREMLLALMRLWDRNRDAIRITWVVTKLSEKKGLIDALAAHRVRGSSWPGTLEMMTRDLQKLADEVLLLARKYMEGGSHNATFKKLERLRDEHLAHRQLTPTPIEAGTDLDRKESDEVFHDTGTIIKTLNSLVNAVCSDPEGSAGVYRHYAQFFWAAARGEMTEGHPNYRPPPPPIEP
jgi:hypothetical protein